GLVGRIAGEDPAIARAAHALVTVEVELHPARDHPEDLLVRMLVARGMRPRLHVPEDDHALVPHHDAAGDLFADLLLGQLLEADVAVHHGDGHGGPPFGTESRRGW